MSEQEAFDPQAPESDGGGGQYITKKDVKVIAIALVAFAVIATPIYFMMKANTEKTQCWGSMGQVYKAMTLYANDHDDRFPPIYAMASGGQPFIDQTGYPFTWISDVSQHLSAKASFKCPSSKADEVAKQQSKDSGVVIESSYGMYVAYASFPQSQVENPNTAILLAETSNHGAASSYDPQPLEGPYDGFAVGWSNSNRRPNEDTKSVTRLAYRDTASGLFRETGPSRHPAGLNYVSVSGEKKYLPPNAANVAIRDGSPFGAWASPVRR